MTLETLSAQSFKCFRSVRLPLAPLTILTGFNAAGKSTVLQSLLLISQGLRNSSRSKFLPLVGPLVRLGTASDVASSTSKNGPVFAFEGFETKAEWSFKSVASVRREAARMQNFNDLTDGGSDRTRLELSSMVIRCPKRGVEIQSLSHLLPDEAEKYELISALKDVIYLGASRGSSLDAYPAPEDAEPINGDIGHEGQFAAWWYVRKTDDILPDSRRRVEDPGITFRSQVDAWLAFLFPGAAANAEMLRDTGLSRLSFKLSGKTDWLRPANVGYGLSYAFPLIVALLTARNGQTIIVDSPEAHLHPRAQSRMGEMLAYFAASGIQILVETHSDHVLSGTRLSVRDNVIGPTHVAIHFFAGQHFEHDTNIISPSIDENGNLSAWPEGFFDQAEVDLSMLAVPK